MLATKEDVGQHFKQWFKKKKKKTYTVLDEDIK